MQSQIPCFRHLSKDHTAQGTQTVSFPAHRSLKLPSPRLLSGITIFYGIFLLLLFKDFFFWSTSFCFLELLVKPSLLSLLNMDLACRLETRGIFMAWEAVEESVLRFSDAGHSSFLLSGRTGSVQNSLRPPCSPSQLPVLHKQGQELGLWLEKRLSKNIVKLHYFQRQRNTSVRSLELSWAIDFTLLWLSLNSHRGSHHLLMFLLPAWEEKYYYRIMCCNS